MLNRKCDGGRISINWLVSIFSRASCRFEHQAALRQTEYSDIRQIRWIFGSAPGKKDAAGPTQEFESAFLEGLQRLRILEKYYLAVGLHTELRSQVEDKLRTRTQVLIVLNNETSSPGKAEHDAEALYAGKNSVAVCLVEELLYPRIRYQQLLKRSLGFDLLGIVGIRHPVRMRHRQHEQTGNH